MASCINIREITNVTVYDISTKSSEKFAKEMKEKFGIPIKVCSTVKETVEQTDIIGCLTSSKEPYLELEWVQEGTHL